MSVADRLPIPINRRPRLARTHRATVCRSVWDCRFVARVRSTALRARRTPRSATPRAQQGARAEQHDDPDGREDAPLHELREAAAVGGGPRPRQGQDGGQRPGQHQRDEKPARGRVADGRAPQRPREQDQPERDHRQGADELQDVPASPDQELVVDVGSDAGRLVEVRDDEGQRCQKEGEGRRVVRGGFAGATSGRRDSFQRHGGGELRRAQAPCGPRVHCRPPLQEATMMRSPFARGFTGIALCAALLSPEDRFN